MACNPLTNPDGCAAEMLRGLSGSVANSAWESVCRSFADAAVELLHGFAKAFVAMPAVDLSSDGIRGVYGISLAIASVVAALLLLVQTARTALTHDGSALAGGLVGLGKAALAFLVTLTIAGTSLVAADELTAFIVERSFGSTDGLRDRLTTVFTFSMTTQPSLLLILAVVGIVLTVVLWFELLLRNAAIAVLIATSPIAAAGQVSEATRGWWSKLVAATVQLIVLKPVIALVFALGFGMLRNPDSTDVTTMLAGMLILLLAVVAWPVIARFFTFASVHVGGGVGLGAVLGFGAARMAGGQGGPPVGVLPDQFGQAAEARTMASMATRTSTTGAAAGGAGGAAAAGAATGGVGAAVAIPLMMAKSGVDMAQRAANSLSGRMEQMAGHAGIHGANPYVHPAGYPHRPPASIGRTLTAAGPGPAGATQPPARPADPGHPPRTGPESGAAWDGAAAQPPTAAPTTPDGAPDLPARSGDTDPEDTT
jgi:hypothetical protein